MTLRGEVALPVVAKHSLCIYRHARITE